MTSNLKNFGVAPEPVLELSESLADLGCALCGTLPTFWPGSKILTRRAGRLGQPARPGWRSRNMDLTKQPLLRHTAVSTLRMLGTMKTTLQKTGTCEQTDDRLRDSSAWLELSQARVGQVRARIHREALSLELLKSRLLLRFLEDTPDVRLHMPAMRAATAAAELAQLTPFPLLFFPLLFEEQVQTEIRRWQTDSEPPLPRTTLAQQ